MEEEKETIPVVETGEEENPQSVEEEPVGEEENKE